ncbi:hypothetical protein NCS55_00503800 [Fusarium keratoplasticum]|nr:hypothetical protein NCS55_00503800 [Fusarium keratoplasticum]
MTTLNPLPECECPKLEPFPHDLAADDVEFLSLLDVPSAHASIFKIKIGEKFYALKLNFMTFLGMRDNPAMGIVKDWVDKLDMDDWPSNEGQNEYDWFCMGPSLSRMLNNLHGLHESGIVVRDLSLSQYIRGILVDLSFAWTIPHPYGPRQGWKPQWTFQSMAAADLHLFQHYIIEQWRGLARHFHASFPADERVRSVAKSCSLRAYDSQVEARHLRPRVGRQRPFLPIVHYQERGLEMIQQPLNDPGDYDPSRIRKKRKRSDAKEPKGRKRVEATKRRTKGRGARYRRLRTCL